MSGDFTRQNLSSHHPEDYAHLSVDFTNVDDLRECKIPFSYFIFVDEGMRCIQEFSQVPLSHIQL